MESKLSIIIPVYNEADQIESCLNHLQPFRQQGHEVIVIDGGSQDNTLTLAKPLCDRTLKSKKSRAIQMNVGANVATGDYFVFLHVDTVLPINTPALIATFLGNEKSWGRFDIQLSGQHLLFRIIESCMNIRSGLTGIATGDQAIFSSKALFSRVNGFPEIGLMEDIAISKLFLAYSKPVCIREKVVSSSRRWEKNGIIRTILKMWLLRLLYFFHFDTHKLQRMYS